MKLQTLKTFGMFNRGLVVPVAAFFLSCCCLTGKARAAEPVPAEVKIQSTTTSPCHHCPSQNASTPQSCTCAKLTAETGTSPLLTISAQNFPARILSAPGLTSLAAHTATIPPGRAVFREHPVPLYLKNSVFRL
jgi:hypothetical protein